MGTASLEVKLIQHLADTREEVLYEIFLDLHKAYNAMDRNRCLEIPEGHVIGPGPLQLLRQYWAHLTMVAWTSSYYGSPFKGRRGVTQGDPLSPTLSNVMVDEVVRHWLAIVME